MKLSPKALGLSIGLMWGFILCILTLLAFYTGYTKHLVDLVVGIYPYYSVTPMGSIAGLIWGFIDGFIGGVIFGWVYNLFAPSVR